MELMREHWEETESHVQSGPAPVAEAYRMMERQNIVIAFGAFDGTELIGYVILFVVPHHHYGFLFAQHDVLFVRKDKRTSSAGWRLIRAAEDAARDRGALFVTWHAKHGSGLAAAFGKRDEYEMEDIIYRKDLACR